MTYTTLIQLCIAIILFLTFLATVYYAIVTRKLWKYSCFQYKD